MHDEQPRDELVGGQGLEGLTVEPPPLVQDLEDPLDPGAVEVRDDSD
ncbi:hypothetical protein [Nocardioides sp.]|nr:hypothetical protein [Nocardioides sp.]MDP3891808.1 hypothetical protein [Nocardioides sp.]